MRMGMLEATATAELVFFIIIIRSSRRSAWVLWHTTKLGKSKPAKSILCNFHRHRESSVSATHWIQFFVFAINSSVMRANECATHCRGVSWFLFFIGRSNNIQVGGCSRERKRRRSLATLATFVSTVHELLCARFVLKVSVTIKLHFISFIN